MTVAVCATVLNEARDAVGLADSLRSQLRAPDELVIVDGGSTDGTADILREALAGVPGAQVIDAPGANISVGRNLAVRATQADVVAFTDAGIMRSPEWLGALIDAAEQAPSAAGAFGYILAAPGNTVETAVGAVGLPYAGEIDPAHYPPSGGSMLLRRQWFDRMGGFPEWLDYGEDLWLDRRIWAAGGWFVHAPGADVRNRPRSSLPAFFRQYYRYAWGDGRAGMLGKRHAARFAAYAVGLGARSAANVDSSRAPDDPRISLRSAPYRAGATVARQRSGRPGARPTRTRGWRRGQDVGIRGGLLASAEGLGR